MARHRQTQDAADEPENLLDRVEDQVDRQDHLGEAGKAAARSHGDQEMVLAELPEAAVVGDRRLAALLPLPHRLLDLLVGDAGIVAELGRTHADPHPG